MRKVLSTFIIIGLIIGVFGCFGITQANFVEALTIDKAVATPDLPLDRKEAAASLVFRAYIESNSDIEVEYYPGGALGDQMSNYEQVRRGHIDITNVMSGLPAGVNYPNLFVFDIPYLFDDWMTAIRVLHPESKFAKALAEDMADSVGVRPIAFAPHSFRHTTSNIRIESVDDLEGLNIRTMEAPAHIAFWEATGAEPSAVSFDELYSSLQTGVVDAQENPTTGNMVSSFYEVQDYYTLTGHIFGVSTILMNEQTYQNLDEKQRKVIDDAAELYFYSYAVEGIKYDEHYLEEAEREFKEVIHLTEEQFNEFKEIMQPAGISFVEDEVDDLKFIELLFDEIDRAK